MKKSAQLPVTSLHDEKRLGFTVVELLIVIAIMGVLVALLLPAIQKARATTRRTACQNKLRQISLAIHQFEASHGAFPAGKSRRSSVEAYDELSWLRQILPYIEQASVWALSERALKVEPFPYFNPPHEPLGMAIPLYACPEDSRVSVPQSASQLNGAFAGLTSYLGVMGTDYKSQDGSFVLGKRIRFADITDGTSNTVMIGERPPTPDFNYGWWYTGMGQDGSGSIDMLLGMREVLYPAGRLAKWNCPPTNRFTPGDAHSMCDGLHFWSLHDGGAHFALCDGSVRFFAYESASVLEQMATRGAAEILSQ
jgi:prepilin-type N-terminal cleavage/methylation domain-containing protein/prepilin-type processing-associated H-X9-DG protein